MNTTNTSPRTLTRAEAHALVDRAEREFSLNLLAAHWDLAGSWNENATFTADDLHEHVNQCADMADGDDTGLSGDEGV